MKPDKPKPDVTTKAPAFNANRLQAREAGGRYAPRQTFHPTKPRLANPQAKAKP